MLLLPTLDGLLGISVLGNPLSNTSEALDGRDKRAAAAATLGFTAW